MQGFIMRKYGVMVDRTGKIYGKLTVISKEGKNKRGSFLWKCKCACGKEKTINGDDLNSGHTKSCGCLKSPNEQDYRQSQKERLLRLSHDHGECRIWKDTCRQKFGYGMIQWRKKTMAAHRAAWIAWKGPIPVGLCVLHKCDNPSCINPNHLFLGTQNDNIKDMISKKRQQDGRNALKGQAHPHSKLKEEDVLYIRNERTNGTSSLRRLAKKFGVSIACIKDANSRGWKHI
jgi:hypothetical protein